MTCPDNSLIAQLAKHLQRPVDDATRARARLHLLDWLACVAGARQTPLAEVARKAAPDVLERAALLGNLLEMDDVHRAALLHPGPVIWTAAVCAARDERADMTRLLDGAVRGYEAMIAIGATFDAHHYALWHPTSTAGGFGAAAAAASIYGMDAERTGWALGNAGSVAGGLWHLRHADVMTKAMHAARAALEGLWLARLARQGFTGPAAMLEGPQGLYAAMTLEAKPLVLSEKWRIGEVSFKPWAACRHTHPAIDAALELRTSGKLAPPFHVETYADAIAFCDKPAPVTEIEAKFSLQHAVAVIADGRNAEPQDFTLAAIAALAPLRAQVSVSEATAFTARYPEHFGARVNGLTLTDTRGDPERPVAQADIVAKLRTLVAWGGLPEDEAGRAIEIALSGHDPAALVAMLRDWL